MERKSIIIFAIILFLSIIAFCLDEQIVFLISYLRSGILNFFFLILSFLSSEILVFLGATGLFGYDQRNRKWILPVWIALGFSALVSFVLKFSIQRLRPFQINLIPVLNNLERASHAIWNFSFPSFSTMMVFSLLPLISKKFPKLRVGWLIFSCLVAFSRIYLGLHFLSDVLLGGLIGYLIGVFLIQIENKNKLWTKINNKILRR